jgi:hypothetical protein
MEACSGPRRVRRYDRRMRITLTDVLLAAVFTLLLIVAVSDGATF